MSEAEIVQLIKEEKNRYAREWRAKNPDRVKAANRKYWLKKISERLASEEGGKS